MSTEVGARYEEARGCIRDLTAVLESRNRELACLRAFVADIDAAIKELDGRRSAIFRHRVNAARANLLDALCAAGVVKP